MKRTYWLPFVGIALVVAAGLTVAGARSFAMRTFTASAPPLNPVVVDWPKTHPCEAEVVSQDAFQTVLLWGAIAGNGEYVQVLENTASGERPLTTGPIVKAPGTYEFAAHLRASVPGGIPLTICALSNNGALTLFGSPSQPDQAHILGSKPKKTFSLVLLSNRRRGLLQSLGTAFKRASLFRPSWVGVWAYWLLLFGLICAIPLGAQTILTAVLADEQSAGADNDPSVPEL